MYRGICILYILKGGEGREAEFKSSMKNIIIMNINSRILSGEMNLYFINLRV